MPLRDRRTVIKEGYVPCLIGRIVEMHGAYYSKLVGFGAKFETEMASDLSDLAARLENPVNAIWRAERDGRIVGSIAIDGESLGDGCALLRFFLVADECRGAGLGKSLIEKAMAFCDAQGFRATHLWTFKGLDAARKLYEAHGFSLAEAHTNDEWGSEILMQRLVRPQRR